MISSVSGGSFTSAYYALNGKEIFNPTSAFHRQFLYHPVQRDLLARAAHDPRNWVTVIRYAYSSAQLSIADRMINPLGFQVSRYRRSYEILPPLSLPTPTLAPPLQPSTVIIPPPTGAADGPRQ